MSSPNLPTAPSPQSIQMLQEHIKGIDGVRIDAGNGGLPRIVVTAPQGDAEVYLHGAHVTAFRAHNDEPVLFMSEKSSFQPDKPIRGGIPICFPWFGPKSGDPPSSPSAPPHGFARLLPWSLEDVEVGGDGTIVLILGLCSSERTRHCPARHDHDCGPSDHR